MKSRFDVFNANEIEALQQAMYLFLKDADSRESLGVAGTLHAELFVARAESITKKESC
ncbi:hypothetical protein [Thermoactinomyces sp. DSM 45892]|uniref:hypothetical protein n=1 Tax=Thermoactinomyces sp. DSM 45892 TaxID=1882753 RepID=UPI00089A73EF|nr:hypothetical protein [Thermoactinomyces sp. DSM 45892]SDY82594.1 hypothetical protein SAMN05444416_1093 [Thermoactinomyces sp. DSM 45892]